MFDDELVVGGYWSAYYYAGAIYGTEIIRGLDVFNLLPSEHLSENEIAAAALADQGGVFNPQQQFAVTWPAEPVVALAYLDQRQRAGVLDAQGRQQWDDALERAGRSLAAGESDPALGRELEQLAAASAGTDGLAGVVQGIAGRLR